ncbi:MAG: transposase [Mangrovibacterium sp.]
MCLFQFWYGLSDYKVEDRVNNGIFFRCFCGSTTCSVLKDYFLRQS